MLVEISAKTEDGEKEVVCVHA